MNKTLREQLAPLATGTQKACVRKHRYESKQHAVGAQRANERKRGEVLYVYLCPHCAGYHLTRSCPPGQQLRTSPSGAEGFQSHAAEGASPSEVSKIATPGAVMKFT